MDYSLTAFNYCHVRESASFHFGELPRLTTKKKKKSDKMLAIIWNNCNMTMTMHINHSAKFLHSVYSGQVEKLLLGEFGKTVSVPFVCFSKHTTWKPSQTIRRHPHFKSQYWYKCKTVNRRAEMRGSMCLMMVRIAQAHDNFIPMGHTVEIVFCIAFGIQEISFLS